MQPLYQNLTKVEPRGSGEKSKAPRFFLGALNLFILRREQDSNLRTSFAGYTLSRRASSTTRAPLLVVSECKGR